MASDRLTALAAAVLLFGALALPAAAKQSDRSQPVHVDAGYADAALGQPNGVSHLKGNVTITQGTLKADSATATVYFDANSQVKRVVLTGSPARLQQQDDKGRMMHGHADTIDYNVVSGIATLTGDAWVDQPDRGSAKGAKLVYNTGSGAMTAQGSATQRVHLVFKPQPKTGSTPAPAGTASAPAPAGTAPAAAGSTPAASSTRGGH